MEKENKNFQMEIIFKAYINKVNLQVKDIIDGRMEIITMVTL